MFFIKNLIFKSLTDRQFETQTNNIFHKNRFWEFRQRELMPLDRSGVYTCGRGGVEDWAPLHKCLFNHPWKVRKVKPPGLIPEYAPTTDPQHMFMIKQERKLTKSSGRRNLFFEQWNWVLASNSDFLSPISLQPNVVDLRYFKV